MNLRAIKPGDIVEVNVKGRISLATVEVVETRQLRVDPHTPTFTWRTINARQVVRRVSRGEDPR